MGVMDRYNKKKKQEEEASKNESSSLGGVQSRYEVNKTLTPSNHEVNEEFVNNFLYDAKRFFDSAEKDYRTVEWKNASSRYDSRYNMWNDLYSRSNSISRWLDKNKDTLDADAYKSLSSTLNTFRTDSSSLIDTFKSKKDYYSQWETEDAYKKWESDQERWLTLDVDATKKQAETYEAAILEAEDLAKRRNELETEYERIQGTLSNEVASKEETARDRNRLTQLERALAEIERQESAIGAKYGIVGDFDASRLKEEAAKLRQDAVSAEYKQTGEKLKNEALSAPDFETNNNYGKTNPVGTENVKAYLSGFHDDLTLNNPITDPNHEWYGGGSIIDPGHDFYEAMSEEEKKILGYYLAHDISKAEEYINAITETVGARVAYGYREAADTAFDKMLFSFASGADQFATGLKGLGNAISGVEGYIPSSPIQMGSAEIRQDIEEGEGFWNGVLGVGYDLGSTTANMMPSILVGMVNPTAGAVLMGASAGGNAYNEMINLGYNKNQARAYGVMVGASEALLEKFLGGISALGGKGGSALTTKWLSKVDNAFARVAIQTGGSMVSEFTEESLQTILEPWFKHIVTGVDYETPDIDEILYSGLLGALSAGFLEGGSNAISAVRTTQQGKEIKQMEGGVERLKKLGTTFSADSVAYQIADKVTNETGAYKIGLLLQEVGATISEQNVSDITIELSKVMDEGSAKKLAKTYQAFLNGEMSLTDEQVAVLEGCDPLSNVLRNKIIGRNTSVYQRTREYSDLVNLAMGMESKTDAPSVPDAETKEAPQAIAPYSKEYIDTMAKEFEDMGMPAEHARIMAQSKLSADTQAKSLPAEENAVESKFEVSAEGKTINTKNGEIAKIKNIESISSNGEVNLTIDDGMVVKASDLSYGTDAEAIFIENIGAIKIGKNPISTTSANALYMTAMSALESNPNMTADEAMSLIKGLEESYIYGTYNLGRSKLTARNEDGSARLYAGELSQVHRKYAYELGTQDAVSKTDADQKVIDDLKAKAEGKPTKKTLGKVIFEKGAEVADESALTDTQRANLNGIKLLAEISSVEFHVFRSDKNNKFKYTMPDGTVTTANGWFVAGTNQIWIDLNAGNAGEGTMVRTAAHEISHYIKEWSPQKWRAMADMLMEEFAKNGVDTESMLNKQIAKIKRRYSKKNMPSESKLLEMAHEELVSDALTDMLTDGSIVDFLAKIKAQDLTLWNKIKAAVKSLLKKWGLIIDDYKGRELDTREAQALSQLEDTFKKLQEMYRDAFMDANEAVATLDGAKPISPNEIITDGATVTDSDGNVYSIRSMKSDIAEGQMFEDLKTYCGFTQRQVNTLKKQLVDLVEYMTPFRDIVDLNETYGREGRRFAPYKPNSDPLYTISLDFSTQCSKRLLTQYVIEQLQLRENRPMSAEEQMAIRDMLKEYGKIEKGLQVACVMCYVEAARLKSPKQIQKWLDDPATAMRNYFADKNPEFSAYIKKAQEDFKESRGYERNITKKDMKAKDRTALNKIRPKLRAEYKPSAEEMAIIETAKSLPNSTYLTAGNLAQLSETHPEIYKAYTAFIRTATRSKALETDEPYYYGDSTRDNGNGIIVSDSFIEAVNRENGMRFSSWSDWRIQHLLDWITAVIDNSVRGAAMHGYTKYGDEVRVLGKTGMMFNMSGVPGTQTGLNEDGSLNFSETESMDYNEAIALRKEFPETAGLQCIGVSKEHIFALLRSDIIDYVIPYHTSGLNATLRRMGDIYGWKDFTYTQHATEDKSIKKENAKDPDHWHQEPVFSEFFVGYNTGLGGIEAMRKSADNYIRMCKERGLTPKFVEFSKEPNYWKLLIDRKMVNQKTNTLIEQKAVTPKFDFGVIKGIVDQYVKNYDSGLEERAFNHIVKNWDNVPQRIRDLKKQGTTKAKSTKKAIDKLANEPIAVQPKGENLFSERETLESAAEKLATISDKEYLKAKSETPFVLVMDNTPSVVLNTMIDDNKNSLANNRPILIRRDALYLAIRESGVQDGHYHGLGKEVIKKLPEYLEKPDVILKTDSSDKRRLVLSHIETKSGQAIISVEFESMKTFGGKDNFYNVIVTVFDLHENYLNSLFKKHKAEIKYEKEDLEQLNPQLYKWLRTINSKSSEGSIQQDNGKSQELFSERDLAPTFYSQMGKVIEGVKQEKLGANSVVNMLRGKGVKAEEIRWSGIVPFLEGKKSVTKQELLDFINGSMLQIGEQISNEEGYGIVRDGENYIVLSSDGVVLDVWEKTVNPEDPEMVGWMSREEGDIASSVNELREYSSDWYGGEGTRWSQYRLDGGENYRELVFTMPNSSYTNQAMRAHWGQDAEGVLAHARIQDFYADGKKMLFIEEIQSDYHNEGHQSGYQTVETDAKIDKLKAIAEKKFFALEDYSTELTGYAGEWEAVEKTAKGAKLLREYREAQDAYDNAMNDYVKKIPDAPFKDNYHEYVLKRLLRMAAEQGYDSIGWTTADIQSERWSKEYAEGYRIEYDQDIPKFLKKYGRQWGAKVDKTALPGMKPISETIYDVNRAQVYHSMWDWERVIKKELRSQGLSAREVNSIKFVKDGEYVVVYGRDGVEYDRAKVFTEDKRVWSMELTDSMKDSVLYEGQVMFSERVTDEETLDFLNEQIDNGEYITVYRSFQVIDGGLYAPMNAMDRDENGKNKKLGYRSEIGVWEQATESRAIAQRYMDTHPDAPYAKFNLDGGDNKTGGVAYNPYLHASNLVLNDQFAAAYRRNLVTVECRVPLSESEGAYKADYAKDGTGWANWKAGGVAGELKKIKPEFERRLFLSRYMLPVKILSDAEVAQMYKDYLDGTDISVPWNVVTPSLRKELEKAGVKISYKDVKRSNGPLKFGEQFPEEASKVLYSERDTDSSNRAILANALESVAQNDIERSKLAQYKEKISLIETEEQRLAEIQKKLFTKGAVEPTERKELQFEAKQIANRINTYDRQLLNLESTTALKNVLNREKALAMKRQKAKDAEYLKQYKEKVAKDKKILLERNQESRKKAIEGRERTAMRHKIKKVVGDLDILLRKSTKERHVPEEMRKAVAEALTIVNMDTVDADARVAHYNDLIAKATDPDVIASLTETRDRIQAQGEKLAEKLTALKESYELIRDSADDSVKSMYDDVIYSRIQTVKNKVGNTPIRNMTLEQLESVYDLYKMVLTTIRDSNKAFAENLQMTRLALGSNTFAEIKEGNKARDTIKHQHLESFLWQNLKPMQAMKTIGSGTLQKLWNNVLYGQEVFAVDYDEAVKFAKEMKEKHGYEKWDKDKLHSFESKSGKVMKLTLEQMMSIYAYSKRAQADEHIEFGGIVLNEGVIKVKDKLGRTKEVKVNDSTAYRLDKMQVASIVATLDKVAPGAKAFVDEMQKYLSETMGAKGNEVSMKMYGIKLFKEEHYFPLKSSKDFMEAANAKLKGDVKIKNKGMTKSTVEHARNPIVLENFLDVWGNHINEMALYHGLVLPLEDFGRTLNYSFKADDKLNTDAESVRTALHDAFGDNADNYLNELLKAINGGVLHDSSAQFADRMISKFKKAKVMASLSVVVQQPTAIIRAMGIIEPKYFVAQNFHHKATWEELKKYCPTAIIKETGSFDTNMGRTIVDMVKDERGFTDKVGDVLGKAPAYMDEMGWNMIWRALKKKVATEKKLSGEALLQECGKQMTLIINETQVYDSVMSRNELMRSKNAFTKMATAFMGEPATVANMIYGAGLDFKRGEKGKATKTITATIASIVINGLVSSLVYAMRDDDEEKTFLEKYLSSATTEVMDGLNPLTYIPYVKDVYSLFQGYKVERTDMALIGDVVDAVNDFYNVLDPDAYEGMSRDETAKHIYENSVPLLTAICDMFGLPVGNVLRDAKAIIVQDNVPMSQSSAKGIGDAFKEGTLSALPKVVSKFVGSESKQDKLYDAIVSGDTAYVNRLKSGYKDDKAYETAVRKALRENDERIKEAAEARIGGNIAEYTRIVKEIKAEGFFSQDTIVASVNAEINAINKGESSSSNSATEDKESSIYKVEDYYAAIVGGDQASAYVVKEDIINTDVANGKDRDDAESSFNSRFASYLRELYENGYISDIEAEDMLVNYGGKSEEDATSKVQYWAFKQEYPDYDDLSEEAVDKYYNEVEPHGISIDVYYDYSKQRSKCKGVDANGDGKTDSGSVKAEVLRVIDSLPLTYSQKDALYYLNGWSAKTIYEAPWH